MMDICYASNENYVPYLAVSMFSCILHNLQDAPLCFHVISNGITAESRKKLQENAELARKSCKAGKEENCVRLNFYELSDLPGRLGGDPDTGSYDISMLGRFFIGELLPEDVGELLYLDCDTIIADSLLPLFSHRKETGRMLYGVPEPTIYRSIVKQLSLKPDRELYINSGVLLVNLDRWRTAHAGERLLQFYIKNGSRLFCGDQDAVNFVLRGEIGYLSPRYNFFTNYKYFRYNTLVRLWPLYARAAGGREAFEKAGRQPAVIHYMGAERPWLKGNRNPYRRQYEEMLALSAFAGRQPEKGKELQMTCYHLMNLVSFICPPARTFISRCFERKHVLPRLAELEE
ncbi:MAG: glycosyltransferase family 8 protein [Eubacteriales bacterium]|nr:glycosyltransferase family 8 protein [Eubacteriales bacterium]